MHGTLTPTARIGTSDDTVFVVVVVASLLLLLVGFVERRRHERRLGRLPWRISVNGSRGKSTVVRLATGALTAGGFRTVGKTTGSEAALVYGWSGEEERVRRRPEGPNIAEQIGVTRTVADREARALVAECMAIVPEYQRVFHERLLRANVLVVTNVLADHLDEMGPTTADVAEIFAESVPRGGTVIVATGPYQEVFRKAARRKRARFELADPVAVDRDLLARFDHLVLDEHVALVLALARILEITPEDAVRGMLRAPADPLATRLLEIGDPEDPALFVNAFGANDPASTLAIWEHVQGLGYPREGLVVVMNCRDDRVPRTRQFTREVLPLLPSATLVVAGSATKPVLRAAGEGGIEASEVIDCTGQPASGVVERLEPLLAGRVVLGVGNLHGGGVQIVHELERLAVDRSSREPGGRPVRERQLERARAGDVRD